PGTGPPARCRCGPPRRQPGMRRRGDHLPEGGRPRGIDQVQFEGEGCTISQAAASVLMELVAAGQLDAESILAMDGTDMMDILGRELVASRPKCATLALGTLKTALRQYRRKLALERASQEDRPGGGL